MASEPPALGEMRIPRPVFDPAPAPVPKTRPSGQESLFVSRRRPSPSAFGLKPWSATGRRPVAQRDPAAEPVGVRAQALVGDGPKARRPTGSCGRALYAGWRDFRNTALPLWFYFGTRERRW